MNAPLDPAKPMRGVFSVSATKQVQFSCGNLQYTQSTQTWSFADRQYEMLGTDNVVGGAVYEDGEEYGKDGTALADKIDLFGWSGSTGTAKWGISTSTDYNDYSGDFADWGQNIGNGTIWRTLTNDEWAYVFDTRTNASTLMGVARIQISESEYANGLILLPDNWDAPAGVTFKSGFASDEYDHQTFTLAEWQKLEQSGAVFLPASGRRDGLEVYNVQRRGYYWSASPYDSDGAHNLVFLSDDAGWDFGYRNYGRAVRLVQDVTD